MQLNRNEQNKRVHPFRILLQVSVCIPPYQHDEQKQVYREEYHHQLIVRYLIVDTLVHSCLKTKTTTQINKKSQQKNLSIFLFPFFSLSAYIFLSVPYVRGIVHIRI